MLTDLEKPENVLASKIIGAAIEVHRELGPGLLESVYQTCLSIELRKQHLRVEREISIPIRYKGEDTGQTLRIDLLVEDLVIVEIKSVIDLLPVFALQVHTYLKASGKKLGILINFNTPVLKDAIRRVVHDL